MPCWAQTGLPQDAFEFWCQTEAQRLRTLQLSRFARARPGLTAGLRAWRPGPPPCSRGAASPGHPLWPGSGRTTCPRWRPSAARTSGLCPTGSAARPPHPHRRRRPQPGGRPAPGGTPPGQPSGPPTGGRGAAEIPADLGDRQVQATLEGGRRLLTGWRIPPRSHPDHLALRMAAQLLGGGQSSRLQAMLVRQKTWPARSS
ncbi:MAG: insulinase family protein [Holophagaceae bacterium]|uniref:Insulinase family protein n=1 Tax=Candidatus Geothrix skivensis TaxID=2954439 RepID=A0A9D7SJ54_9BACT|nr:insulinase family protein [Candidatus Geothrix skivensis]